MGINTASIVPVIVDSFAGGDFGVYVHIFSLMLAGPMVHVQMRNILGSVTSDSCINFKAQCQKTTESHGDKRKSYKPNFKILPRALRAVINPLNTFSQLSARVVQVGSGRVRPCRAREFHGQAHACAVMNNVLCSAYEHRPIFEFNVAVSGQLERPTLSVCGF